MSKVGVSELHVAWTAYVNDRSRPDRHSNMLTHLSGFIGCTAAVDKVHTLNNTVVHKSDTV